MVKSERLFFIAQLVKNHAPITIKQMSSECGVSERTLYRDFNSLSQLNVPIFHDPGKGYRLARNIEFTFGEIRSDEADLILFCLYHNPLNNSPFLRRRLAYLREILQQKFESSATYDINSFFQYDASYRGFLEIHREKIMKFVFALFNQNFVIFSEKRNLLKTRALIPIGIRFKQNGATFILYSEHSKNDCRIDIDDIEAISIAPQRFTHRPKVDMRLYSVHEEAV
ncbi:MAG: HTH domain-containing protein [Bacteroidetes bacterium]|nr:HTH domain-containing protein [Bacteroidota bacterium]